MARNIVCDSLYQLCCGLLRSLREANRTEVNILEDPEFTEFRGVLDGQMKKQNATGRYIEKRKASVISIQMKERLWEKGLLGDHSPRALVDTLVYLNGLYSSLSGVEMSIGAFDTSLAKSRWSVQLDNSHTLCTLKMFPKLIKVV